MPVKVYDGTNWVTVAGDGQQGAAATSSSIATWVKTASGGETSLSGNDDNSVSLSYTVGQELLYINGVLQKRAVDYVATTGTTITGLNALAASDVVTVWTVNAFSVTNAIPNSTITAKGDLIVGTGSGTYTTQTVGTNGQVLTADSTSGDGVAWATPGGGMTLISTTAVTATASVDLTSIPQTYKDLYIIVDGVYENSGAGQSLTWNNYTSGFSYNVIQASNANTVTVSTSAGSINLGGSLRFVAGSGSGSMAISISNYASTTMQKIATWYMGGGNGATTGSGSYGGIAAITSVKITWAGTPSAQGNVYLYGVK